MWILLILAVVDVFLVRVRPLQYVTDLRFIPLAQHPMVSKIPVFLESRDRTNLFVLGSSQPMCAIAEYDEKCYGEPHCKVGFELSRYMGARYLEEQLSQKARHRVKVANMSIVACMASDMFIILSHSILAGKKPDSVLVCVASRDFVDNHVQPIGLTPPFEVLQDWKSLNEVLRPSLKPSERRALIISSFWYFYRVKIDYRTVITQYCSKLLRRPSSLYYASRSALDNSQPKQSSKNSSKFAGSDAVFERIYRPPNFQRFAVEMEFFQKLLSLFSSAKSRCTVVNMPVSLPYQAFLDARLRHSYMAGTKRLCAVYGAKYLDFNDREFSNQDFSDGFHLNAFGAEKFQKRLILNMVKRGELGAEGAGC